MVWFSEPEQFDNTVLATLVEEDTGGELHASVRQGGRWLDRDELATARRRLAEAHARYGKRPEHLDDAEWSEIAGTLSAPREARFGRVSLPLAGVHYDVLAAADSWFGLIAATEGTDVHVRTFRKEPLADALVAGLAEVVWHCGEQPIRVRQSALRAAEQGIGLREPSPSLARLERLMRLPIYLSCEFYAECQQPGGPRRQSRWPLRVYGLGDEGYDVGCWTVTITPHGTDRELLFAPADIHDLADRIERLRRDLD